MNPIHSATCVENISELDILYLPESNKEPKNIHFKKNVESLSSSVRLFYYNNLAIEDLEKNEHNFIDITTQDVASLSIVESERTHPLLKCVLISDQGGIFVGYVSSEVSMFTDRMAEAGRFSRIQSIQFVTDEEDKKDSEEYYTEYSKEFLWKDIEVGDFIKYMFVKKEKLEQFKDERGSDENIKIESELRYEYLEKVIQVVEDGIEIEITSSLNSDVEKKKILFSDYPRLNVLNVLGVKRFTTKPIWVLDYLERKSVESESIRLEVLGGSNEKEIIYLDPTLFPITYLDGINAPVLRTLPTSPKETVTTYIDEVSRLRSDVRPELQLTSEEQDQLQSVAVNFFIALKSNQFDGSRVEQFVSLDDLYIDIDGFPHDYRAKKTVAEKIRDMEDRADEMFGSLEADLLRVDRELVVINKAISDLEAECQKNPEDQNLKQELFKLKEKENALHQTRNMLLLRKELWPDENALGVYKKAEQKKIEAGFVQEKGDMPKVLAQDLNTFFKDKIPNDMTPEILSQIASFRLISENQAVVTVPKSPIRVRLKLIQGQWKIEALTY